MTFCFPVSYTVKSRNTLFARLRHKKKYKKKSHRSSFIFARWQQQFAIACFRRGFDPQISPSPGDLTRCVTGPHNCTCQMASKSVERFKQGPRMSQTTDRQTDHATEKCVATGGNRLRLITFVTESTLNISIMTMTTTTISLMPINNGCSTGGKRQCPAWEG